MLKKVLMILGITVVLVFVGLSLIKIPAPAIEVTKEVPITQQA